MKKTPLKRKTPLKAHTTLKSNSTLKAKTALKAKSTLKTKSTLKCKQKTARKLSTPYKSIFSDSLDRCYITGATTNIHPHHIFGASKKALSEKYGFILPLRADWHEGTTYSIHQDRALDLKYKCLCEKYYITTLNKTKEEWIEEFGMWWEEESA